MLSKRVLPELICLMMAEAMSEERALLLSQDNLGPPPDGQF
jgi:hypothetical protein